MMTPHDWPQLVELSEEKLRVKVMLPLLAAMPNIKRISDVHGRNEKGLDIIFYERSAIEDICYGLQLKQGNIAGGGTNAGTVREIVNQLDLARDLDHSVAVEGAGRVRIDRFIVATSGKISDAAREEIASRIKGVPVTFWTGTSIERLARLYMPELFSVADGAAVVYLKHLIAKYDSLDTLDQIPGVAKRSLTQVYEEPTVRRRFDPALMLEDGEALAAVRHPALRLLDTLNRCVVIADQDAGKTTLLRMMALQRAREILGGPVGKERCCLPVVLRASEVVKDNDVIATIKRALEFLNGGQLAETIDADLAETGYFLLVDGFSELLTDDNKIVLELLLREFWQKFPRVRVLVTGRPVDFLTPRFFQDYRHYVIEDFSHQQVASLLNRWTSDSPALADVARKLVRRVREALQLPGSPISATIGVMLYEKERRFITNIAEAVDRYMVIRLGRYAEELGMRQQVDWTRKQDLLGEIAFEMINNDWEALTEAGFIAMVDSIYHRFGEEPMGSVILGELLEGGVLVRHGPMVSFHRLAFRDFFAAHGINQRQNRDQFFRDNFFIRKWGLALTFAAGLRRRNGQLLFDLLELVESERERAIGTPSDDYYYGAYLLGRLLSNSETTDEAPRLAVLEECVRAFELALPEFVATAKKQFGNIGELAALMGSEQSFFLTVGVPWLSKQLRSMAEDGDLSDDGRYLAASTFLQLGGAIDVVDALISEATSTKILAALKVLLANVMNERNLTEKQSHDFKRLLARVNRRLAKKERKEEMRELTKMRSKILELEAKRLSRLDSGQ